MFIGLKDFDVDIFLKLDDSEIYIYYADLESLPQLVNYLPLGSFEDDQLKFTALSKENRINVGMEFLYRDGFAGKEEITLDPYIRINRFMEQFSNIPEVVDFFDKWILMCELDNPASWCTDCDNAPEGIECPDYYNMEYNTCAIKVPLEEFTDDELYYIIVLYFNGIYRTNAKYAQELGVYQILTDINFDLNYYSLIIDIKEFFTKEFIYFIKTLPGAVPFANDYGTGLKLAVQTKNFVVQQLEVEEEINFFIRNFNAIYGSLVNVKDIQIQNVESDIGADSWVVEVYADIMQERLIYRLEI